jgi:8-oxo-dGTP pyrophosphatase MutT (NUDIX family)
MPHIHEKVDFTVEVFIVHKNKVLLRMHDKFKIWLSVGGHIELDEDPVEAAYREVKEEVGLDIEIAGKAIPESIITDDFRPLITPRFLCRHNVTPTHEHICFVYFATTNTDHISESSLDHEKGMETKWVSMEELKQMDLVPNVRFYAEEALKALSNE